MKNKITETIIGCGMKIHSTLGSGFLESAYGNALAHEPGKAGLSHQRETPINVVYDNQVVGQFRADFRINEQLILELKAVENLCSAHEVQLVNYLKATHIDIGLLLNFGAPSFQFKRKFRTHQPKQDSHPIRLK